MKTRLSRSLLAAAVILAALAPPALADSRHGERRPLVIGHRGAIAAPVVKPMLRGIVIDGARSRAFLEDPALKRVSGYSVGDSVNGGRVQSIADDRVTIVSPEGVMEVLLQDPSKPRPAPTVVAGSVTTVGQVGPGQPGPQLASPGQFTSVQAAPAQGMPAQVSPASPEVLPNHSQAIPAQGR